MKCPCGSGETYAKCCEPFIKGETLPPTAEKLMRSRYTAYTLSDVDYIKKTLAPESQSDFDSAATKKWASEAQWKGLKIMSVQQGSETDKKGVVEFMATYTQDGESFDHHEVSK